MTSSKNSGKFLQQGYGVSHNETLGIQGGDSLGRYHLTPAEYAALAYLGTTNHWTGINTFDNFVATGTPTVPTAAVDTNTTQIASTAFVIAQGYLKAATAVSTYAPLASPALTGNPTATTQSTSDDSTRIATTAFVHDITDNLAPINSPTFTGTPAAPTQPQNDNSTKIATTAYADRSSIAVKGSMGLYIDTPLLNPTVIRNSQMDNSLPISGKQIFKVLTSGAFTSAMIGRRFKCTNAGSGTGNFQQGTTVLLKHCTTTTPYLADLAANTPLVLNDYYIVVAAGTPDTWGGSELTPFDTIEAGKWYIVQNNTITYKSTVHAASTYNAYATTYIDGQNLSPVIFQGVSGYTTYTGTGDVFELNYLVCEDSTGDGTTSGTITLNWVPNMYSLFNPTAGQEWALHAVTYGGVTRDKTLKITGGDYATRTLDFEVSGSGGYTVFSAADFENRMVSFYNPFNSTFDIDFSTAVLPVGSRPAFAGTYTIANGLFKRKTDGKYCGLFYGYNSSLEANFGKIGYFTTDDFVTTTIASKPIFDGKLTNTYLSSGNLTIGKKYKVIATETNHFGTGVVVGDYFTASATTVCDANNIVRLVDSTWKHTGMLSSVSYLGQANDGKYLWEAIIYLRVDISVGRLGQKVEFVQFDETFSDEHMKFKSVELNEVMGDAYETNMYMIHYPYYTFYNGVHRIAVLGFTTNLSTSPMYTYEYLSSNGKYGPYTTRNVIHQRIATNDAYPCSRDIELFNYFIYNSKLYALAAGTSISAYCGFDADKREVSLYRYNDVTGTWIIDSRSPVMINPIYSTATLWNCILYAQYHISAIAMYIEGGIMYILATANVSSNTYQVFYGTLDLKNLGPS